MSKCVKIYFNIFLLYMPPRTTKKCFSKCRKLPQNKCGPNICKYINGKKYKYCRLSHKYKLDTQCNITKKKSKNKLTKKQARLKINSFINKKLKNNIYNKTKKVNNAANKIQQFMTKNRMKIKSRFLQSICSDSGVCLAFGNASNEIKKFFNNFVNKDFIKFPLKKIGKTSANGFVYEITYKRENYTAHSIIKSSVRNTADNLFYEYLCGLVVNSWNKRFSCFLETYGLFKYERMNMWNKAKNNENITEFMFKNFYSIYHMSKYPYNIENTSKLYDDISRSCLNSKTISIMIQHIKNAQSFYDFFKNTNDKRFFADNQLIAILYQIYFPLHALNKLFTHYDLHSENVIIYQPNKKGYIHYHYILSNGNTIDFKSQYMVKIIDYGRCYFKDSKNINFNSRYIFNHICKVDSCLPNCGSTHGYNFFSTQNLKKNYYISSTQYNQSHDLRLLHLIKKLFGSNRIISSNLHTALLNKLKYETDYGTPHVNNNLTGKKVQTVHDAFRALTTLLDDPDFIIRNDNEFQNLQKIGDLYIYEKDKPMRFTN